jgi:lipopolysaccharide biosynthesis glycosyltransferase
MKLKVFIGWDYREVEAWRVLEHSIRRHSRIGLEVYPLILGDLQYRGLYNRPTEMRDGRMFDVISEAPMSTEFAISRFLVPQLAGSGYALFMDSDMLACRDFGDLLKEIEPGKPVYCVKHKQEVTSDRKMDGQVQLPYGRKNWSSFMLFDCDHPLNKNLTVKMVNEVPGRDLHAMCWLPGSDPKNGILSDESNIGSISTGWNWLEGYSDEHHAPINVVHYTRGGPWMRDWQLVKYADLWLDEKKMMGEVL